MSIESTINKIGDWTNDHILYIIIGIILFVIGVKQGIIPEFFTIQTMSVFGGTSIAIGTGVFLIAVGVALAVIPGVNLIVGPLFVAGTLLIGGGAAVGSIIEFAKSLVGMIIIGVIGMILYLRIRRKI